MARISGGSLDDQALARVAFGRPSTLDAANLEQGLRAIRATDRFRAVDGLLAGPVAEIRLEPWPRLTKVRWGGDELPRRLRGDLAPSLRPGIRLGDRRLEAWRLRAEARLKEEGYPEAVVAFVRADQDRALEATVHLGTPALVREIRVEGTAAPYAADRLRAWTGLVPGRSLWTEPARRAAIAALRRRFMKDRRYEGAADLRREPDGTVVLTVQAGPVVELAVEGPGLPWFGRKDLVPLAKADRYSPELVEEGDRRLLRRYLAQGYLDAKVLHRREIVEGPADRPARVRMTYSVAAGPRFRAVGLRFEGHEAVAESDLRRAADLPGRSVWSMWTRLPDASPEQMGAVEDRVRAFYLRRGYADVRVRRRVERSQEGATLVMVIREGERRAIQDVVLDLPTGPPWRPDALGAALARLIADRPEARVDADPRARRYRSDRASHPALEGVLSWGPAEGEEGVTRVVFRLDRPIPYVKNDFAPVLADLRQQVAALGGLKPQERMVPEEVEGRVTMRIVVPAQPLGVQGRLAVFGADDTRARAILREARWSGGQPLDPRGLGQAQARLGNLGAFQRVDLMGLEATTFDPGPGPWKPGDMLLGLEERSPWAFTAAFGYDKSQGYHVGFGVQRLNLGGMGRTLDFGIRAGDATIQNPTLRKAFPTGVFNRSVDSYTLAYADPGLEFGLLGRLLPERALYQAEGAYVEELQAAYRVRRRRVQNSLEWRLDEHRVFRAGHRYERVEVQSGIVDFNHDDLLNRIARTPGRAVISAPTFQLIRDTRDSPFDPTRGSYFSGRVDFANQLFGTSSNTSFVRLDLRQQWHWPLGDFGRAGVFTLGVRLGVAKPTAGSAKELPLSERFFAGGSFSHRAVEPDFLGPWGEAPVVDPVTRTQRLDAWGRPLFQTIPLGGQALALVNLEYRFPLVGQSLVGEVFLDSGQVYQYLNRPDPSVVLGSTSPHPPFLTGLGVGLIWKVGIPIKVEYGADVRRILGRPRSDKDRQTQLRGVLISAGFQF